jgi:hypothetical protein
MKRGKVSGAEDKKKAALAVTAAKKDHVCKTKRYRALANNALEMITSIKPKKRNAANQLCFSRRTDIQPYSIM